MNFSPCPDPETVGEIVRRFEQYKPVTAAFWAKETDRSQWQLYLAFDETAQEGHLDAVPRLVELTRDDPTLFDLVHETMLISGADPMVKAVREIGKRNRMKNNQPIPYSGGLLGTVNVDGAWIYPTQQPVPV